LTLLDAPRIGEVHCRSRAEAYPAFLPPERVNWRPLAERQEQWKGFLGDPGYRRDRFLVVLETEEGIKGFAAGGPQRSGDDLFPGEVWSLYLLRAVQGRGLGRLLMTEMARRLLGAGFPALIVWTQGANAPARGFYEHLCGVYVRTRLLSGFEIVGYGWRDLRALL
jgi:GNAT superfamily N-acetyltransferase